MRALTDMVPLALLHHELNIPDHVVHNAVRAGQLEVQRIEGVRGLFVKHDAAVRYVREYRARLGAK